MMPGNPNRPGSLGVDGSTVRTWVKTGPPRPVSVVLWLMAALDLDRDRAAQLLRNAGHALD